MRYLLVAGALALAVAPLGAADKDKKDAPAKAVQTFEVPYRLTDTKHVMVRVKLNGKGPFNFIIDTGAPALILTEATAKKTGAKVEKGWASFDSMEIEGGIKLDDARGIAIDPFQLKGMNSMGLAGVELHGMMGYHILARFKIEYDFTETKLKWTPVDFKVPDPKRIEIDKNGGQGGLEMIGSLMQMLSAFGGIKPNFAVAPRGFLGAELEASKDELIVKSLVAGGPADKAGLKVGDQIQGSKGKNFKKTDDLLEIVKKLPEGTSIKLSIKRGDETKDITVELGKGL